MRYADNLASGSGLVWNPGERPPVEGYTNLGWTLLMGAVLLTVPKLLAPIVISAFGAAIVLACGLAARQVLKILGFGPVLQLAGAVAVLAYFPLVFWTLRGMEVGLVTLF